jgi:CheY-like chemotaxis protein
LEVKVGTRKKVLVVEDYNDVRRMMIIMLRHGGFDVIEATDGYDAVEKAVEERPDMIFMDLAMPLLDGLSATKAIRANDELAHVPIIAITAYHDFYHDKALRAGCNEVIQKPIDFDQLQPLVNQYCH